MSSAHIFYLPIFLAIGFIAGFFAGRRAAEQEAQEAARRIELKKKKSARSTSATHAPSSEDSAAEDPAP